MPTTIDSLLITLGLDASQFKAGSEQALAYQKAVLDQSMRTARQMEAEGARAAQFFGAIKTEALSLIGVLVGGRGIEQFIKETTVGLADLGRQARNIGEAAGPIEAFAMAIERAGGSAASARGVLQAFAESQAQWQLYGKGNFGVDMALIGGNLNTKPLEAIQLFQQFIDRTKDVAGGIQRINLLGRELFGFDQATLNAMVQMGNVATLNREIGRSYELGTPTAEQIERATRLQAAFIGLMQAGENAGIRLASDMSPALLTVIDDLTRFIVENKGATEAVLAFTVALTALGAVKIGAGLLSLMGITGPASALGGLTALLGRLTLIGTAIGVTLEALHISGAGSGEDAELARLRAAHSGGSGGGGGGSTGPPLPADIEAEVRRQAALRGLDADQMVRLVQKEGGGYSNVSPAGAFGPMQLMPGTAASMGVGPNSPWQQNVSAGLDYFSGLLRQFGGNYAAAEAAYNAGPNNAGVQRFAATGDMSGLPRETKDYVSSIGRAGGGPAPTVLHPAIGRAGGGPAPTVLHPATVPPAAAAAVAQGGGGDKSRPSVTIGTMVVNTRAPDAPGTGREIYGALVAQANRGPQ